MLYRIEIENFFSVRERQVIDLTVGRKVPDEPGRLVPIHDGSDLRAPSVVAIYGANASGKSNVLRAVAFAAWFIQSSFQQQAGNALLYQKFETKEMIGKITRLSLTFAGLDGMMTGDLSKTCPYVYTLELSSRDTEGDRVILESLYYRPSATARMSRIFERNEDGEVKAAKWVATSKELSVLKSILRPDASVISTLGQLNNALALNFIRSANAIDSNILLTRFEQSDSDLLKQYARNDLLLLDLNRDIRRIDLGVDQVHIVAENGGPVARFVHAGLDGALPLLIESHGTQQFFKIYPLLHRALALGGIALVDELDVAIHPAILPEILRWFFDPDRNPHGAQLWMSCHAVSLLDDLLKEEVVICEKSPSGATEVYRLADIQGIRRDDNILQKYLGGVYGGVPSIG
ncbi:AAA family ATPase [Loktanella sp. M215]|uniref:AAA family ATPase n=1 Tax=Loktanella sp. M215 TaxID=2675431 RepID=UPI001F013195|nr:ATP-binding protein [Loktanella sp. M215]MCF7701859.1 AAA family ATPase [Loktanella sp. M215]